ncbi:ribosome maturation factor RimM [Limosilactobacillus fastidiosus]|uniref:Ribosome maturation factor RimM n=1 Tax=Limosilactobacillus fastidiosus TaxID=2759855 RepID=A0A7W3YD16_9LACO|nr:ribosome maturation factor RimM [Limosilactobacillus fastidiosus]MBB1086701.1 ribosome maturation factor RimM [Limosilactobacillus fastidiosus]MCD7085572.1 ribosome maturation factor RimM [Limosilactobacillus fastidiosus]MCD7114803.1 ribosome maturation factor RimM [Limosilactobacillus fastidiosus]MCD7115948.1 ribosome maturation factor RimM [Limosilactobacillus fastidiosus]
MKFYNVGKVVNTHGIRGEVRVIPTTDFVDKRFAKGAKLYLDESQGEPVELTIESARPHKGSLLVKFVGYDNINDVEVFRNHKLMVSEKDQQPLEDGSYYYHQIIGLTVKTVDGRELGKIKEILSPGANDVWVVQRPKQSDLLLPKIDDVIKNVDLEKGIVEVELLEGLE